MGKIESGYYFKILGSSSKRATLDVEVSDVIEKSNSKNAVYFSKNGRKPEERNEGDIVFMGRMTEKPNDYAIFGMARFDGREGEATNVDIVDIKKWPWMTDYPIIFGVREFTALNSGGTLKDCIFLYRDLLKEFGVEGFQPTYQRHKDGEKDINPKKALCHQPGIWLTKKAGKWLESRFKRQGR